MKTIFYSTMIILIIILLTLTSTKGLYIPIRNIINISSIEGVAEEDLVTISKTINKSTTVSFFSNLSSGVQLYDIRNNADPDQENLVQKFKKKKKRVVQGENFDRIKRSLGNVNNPDVLLYIRGRQLAPKGRNSEELKIQIECANISRVDENPHMCYQCSSNVVEDKDPVCDHTLWRFTRRSEKYKLRVRCPHGHGSYCVKKVQNKRGLQITERGCFGPGPVAGKDGTLVELQEGCVTYRQNGFLTTTCLCSVDLCNRGNNILSKPLGKFVSMTQVLVILIVLKYIYITDR